ncbi:MAG: DNA polymerase III subunit gamma/tau [Elusimicrobia bacterium]|nr:DNA polymerase III subunit gamma/tau [Elusimicrobiota bacterium]
MSYLVLARKYRPQTFEDVVGQTPVSRTLANALSSGRVAHGYIFSGPRGVGKTTTARILAKCLNCVKGPTITPCNVCPACVSISQGTSTDDVLEIDGASNRGIDQIRDLRESAKYAPAHSRYRIYIIDEAHQITKDAFGALLKTLEEPPEHVIFMMATTEVQKIPAPILSRCQRFSLRPISSELVFKHLKEICAKEKVKVDDAALADIVRFVEGSLRDALSLLDQALVFSPDGITAKTVRELLGLLPLELIDDVAGVIQAGEPAAILKKIDETVKAGVDLTQLAKDLQSYYHGVLLDKAGVQDPFQVENDRLRRRAAALDFATLERNIRLLSQLLEEIRNSETPRALFEVHALRLGQKTLDPRLLIERLEKLERQGPVPAKTFSNAPPSAPERTVSSAPRSPAAAVPAARPAAPSVREPAPPPEPAAPAAAEPAPVFKGDPIDGWPAFVDAVAAEKPTLAGALEEARVSVEGGKLLLTFSRSFSQDLIQRSVDLLKPLIARHLGKAWPLEFRLEKAPASAAPAKPAPRPPVDSVDPEVAERLVEVKPEDAGTAAQRALKHFPGTVKKERR